MTEISTPSSARSRDTAVPVSDHGPSSTADAASHHHHLRTKLVSAHRVVIKVGTNVVMRDDGQIALARLYAIAESIATLRQAGRDVVLVTSGAIGLGAHRLALPHRPHSLALKQACAAVGQGRLMALYADAFDRLGVVSAQILLTEDDFAVPERYHNLRATLDTLLDIGAVPIVNENDTVSTLELERTDTSASRVPIFGDNDKLSALIATKLRAGLLVLLSDVDGLCTADPSRTTDAVVVPVVREVTPTLLASVAGAGDRGRGGMTTKLNAASLAMEAGIAVVIANGRSLGIIDRICAGDALGTFFVPGEVT